MEDQGKRLMLAVGIAFGIMLLWTTLFPPEKPPKKIPEKEVAEQVEGKQTAASARSRGDAQRGSASSGSATTGEVPVEATPVKTLPRGEEQIFEFESGTVRARFSSYGGALTSYELMVPRLRNHKTNTPENLVRVDDEAYRNLRVWFEDSTFNIPRDAEWLGEKRSDTEMRFTWESSDFRVVKDITLHPKQYLIVMDVSFELVNASEAKQALAISLYSQQDPKAGEAGMFDRVERLWKSACFVDGEVKKKSTKSLAKKGEKKRSGEIYWGGFDHAYFLVASSFKDVEGRRTDCNAYPLEDVVGGMGIDMVQDSVNLKGGEPGIRSRVAIYIGPKYRGALGAASKTADVETKFEESVDLGFLGILSGPLLSLLNFFQGFVVNWGIAIFLLTLVVKGLTLPWTHKSMKSMKAMSRLKPQLEKIKEKYKDDRARQNTETMNLFKAHKVNPMSGCLPMLLQMPIWFALYRSLTVAGELYQAPFIAGWIDDLTLPDPYYVMPVLLTGMMFLQTRLTPSTGSGAQQKMLMYGMPIMFGVFSFFFPAGLTLYIFTNTCFTALHHLYMHKQEPAAVAAHAEKSAIIEAASEEKDAASEDKTKSGKSGAGKSQCKSKSKKKSGQGKKKRKR
ncbi:MAG: membrane protein insertase YidC [Myxococcales bacterium]|nr:membrane protein insertase YidC [Myxococcales bacterium]